MRENHANLRAQGKRDALMGKKPNPSAILPYSYKKGYTMGLTKLKQDAEKVPKKDFNPVAHCAACYTSRREKAFGVYDSANDKFYCSDAERMGA